MEEKKKPKEVMTRKELPIEWNVSNDIVARYATNMIIQRLENEFLISFFEIKPPFFLGDPEQITKKLKGIDSVQANCVAQIIVAHNKLQAFIDALSTNLSRLTENSVEGKE